MRKLLPFLYALLSAMRKFLMTMRKLLALPFALLAALCWFLADLIWPPGIRATIGGPYVYRETDTQIAPPVEEETEAYRPAQFWGGW